jgi:hypothetical protein
MEPVLLLRSLDYFLDLKSNFWGVGSYLIKSESYYWGEEGNLEVSES